MSEDFCKFKDRATTLDFTILAEEEPSNVGTGLTGTTGPASSPSTAGYFKLTYAKGDKTVKRKDLICNNPYPKFIKNKCGCNVNDCKCIEKIRKIKCDICKKRSCTCKKKIVHLATFVAQSDLHIIDATNPSRATFLAAFRSYEAFSTQVAECMIRKINAVEKGPILGQPFAFSICTGDLSDSQTINELVNFVSIMDGTRVVPNPASCKYVGVQDNVPSEGYSVYYHPDPPPSGGENDIYKTALGYPNFENILDVANRSFCATGLRIPWYTCSGNHDQEKIGNVSDLPYQMWNLFNQISTGTIPGLGSKLIDLISPAQALLFAEALQKQDANAILAIYSQAALREVPRSGKRRQFSVADFISEHFKTTTLPKGHGFSEFNIENSVAYYTFRVAEKITGIVLDTNNPNGNLLDINEAPNGAIGTKQVAWMEQQLQKVHSNYFNSQGDLIYTNNKDELVLIYGHHSIRTQTNNFNDVFDEDPQRILGDEFLKILHRYPNVIAYICGHEHKSRIFPHVDCTGRTQGLWEVLTPSHIDFPQQSRIIEIGDNQDGTLSIFCTMIDHQSPPNAQRGCFPTGPGRNCCGSQSSKSDSCCKSESQEKESYTISEIASISRELSYNDVFIVDKFDNAIQRRGSVLDRNVNLLIFNPLLRCYSKK
jgi:metallophosphoesterase (TIGR03767 family)